MTEDKTHYFKFLLEKYRSNSLSAQEFQEFIRLLGDQERSDGVLDQLAGSDWEDSKELLRNIQRVQKQKSRSLVIRNWSMRIAASLLLVITAWMVWPTGAPENLIYQTGYGETRDIELPDGSRVLLNANSEIEWAGDWKDRKTRSVVLKGEAFFDVVKTENINFEVSTPDIKVDVLGTEFNVRYRGVKTDVFLQEGKVRLEMNNQENQNMEMEPGDYVEYDRRENKISTASHHRLQEKASWVDGMLEFQNESVPGILKDFENLYGKTFRVENEILLDKRMDVSLPYADWNLVRKALEIALDVEFTSSRDTIIVK